MFGRRRHTEVEPARLRTVAFFGDFDDDTLARVAALGTAVEVDRGQVLIEQGRVGLECFVILSGAATVELGDEEMAHLGAGEMVGEMALVDHLPRHATVVADTDMELIAFDIKHFRTLLAEVPLVHERVQVLLAERTAEIERFDEAHSHGEDEAR